MQSKICDFCERHSRRGVCRFFDTLKYWDLYFLRILVILLDTGDYRIRRNFNGGGIQKKLVRL